MKIIISSKKLLILLVLLNIGYVLSFQRKKNKVWRNKEVDVVTAPFVAGLKPFKCTGFVLSAKWVVTAAHCFDEKEPHGSVVFGTSDYDDDTALAVTIKRIIPHESYAKATSNQDVAKYDVALVELDDPVEFSEVIQPLLLNQADSPVQAMYDLDCTLTAFATNDAGGFSLMSATFIAEHDETKCSCVDSSTGCVKSWEENDGPCLSETGAPLVCKGRIVAISAGSMDINTCEGGEVSSGESEEEEEKEKKGGSGESGGGSAESGEKGGDSGEKEGGDAKEKEGGEEAGEGKEKEEARRQDDAEEKEADKKDDDGEGEEKKKDESDEKEKDDGESSEEDEKSGHKDDDNNHEKDKGGDGVSPVERCPYKNKLFLFTLTAEIMDWLKENAEGADFKKEEGTIETKPVSFQPNIISHSSLIIIYIFPILTIIRSLIQQ